MKQLNRRDFLRSSIAGAVLAAAAPLSLGAKTAAGTGIVVDGVGMTGAAACHWTGTVVEMLSNLPADWLLVGPDIARYLADVCPWLVHRSDSGIYKMGRIGDKDVYADSGSFVPEGRFYLATHIGGSVLLTLEGGHR